MLLCELGGTLPRLKPNCTAGTRLRCQQRRVPSAQSGARLAPGGFPRSHRAMLPAAPGLGNSSPRQAGQVCSRAQVCPTEWVNQQFLPSRLHAPWENNDAAQCPAHALWTKHRSLLIPVVSGVREASLTTKHTGRLKRGVRKCCPNQTDFVGGIYTD